MSSSIHGRSVVVWAACILLQSIPSAAALEIQLRFDEAFTARPAARSAIERAAVLWEAVLADPIELAIDVRLSGDLGFSTGADSLVIEGQVPYVSLLESLSADATSIDDATALAHLQPGPLLTFRGLAPDRSPSVNTGSDFINEYVLMSTANAKALSYDVGELESDGEICFNTFMLDAGFFDADRADGIEGFDLTGLAAHEIAHVLGFNSGVDAFDRVFQPSPIPPEEAEELPTPEELPQYSVLTPLDLFRYSAASGDLIDMTPGADAYFSLDGGANAIAQFSTGRFNGDGLQASHWRGAGGILDGRLAPDTVYDITAIDLRAMDAIGWDVRAVPEPCTAILPVLAFAVVTASRRARVSIRSIS